jgi:N-acetylglucosamine-6-phosphate deacetylase
MILQGATLVLPTGVDESGWVRIEGDRIVEIGSRANGRIGATGKADEADEADEVDPAADARSERVSLTGGWLVPGFIDMHCHGGDGASFAAADPEQLERAANFHLRHGTTTVLASLVTNPLDSLLAQLDAVAEHSRSDGPILGAHLEGPYLSHARCGAQNPDFLLEPDLEHFGRLVQAADGTCRMMTLAPELPGALKLIDAVRQSGMIAAVGHTDATYEQAVEAFERGAAVATHLFNGMRGVHHREPGPVLAALDSGAACEVINDGVHVHPAVLRLVADRDPGQLLLITDAIDAAGVGDGRYLLGGQSVRVHNGQARLDNGSLAGSVLTMDQAFRRAVRETGLAVIDAVAAASTNPARVLGLSQDRGAIRVGLRADLVHLDADFRPVAVMRGGKWITTG